MPINWPKANPLLTRPPASQEPIQQDFIPELERWDSNGDIYAPRNPGAENYVPAPEAAPPQLPTPTQRTMPVEFEPNGVHASYDTAAAPLTGFALGFTAHAVLVDNLSSKWIYFPSALRYVPPNTVGVMLTLIPGTQVASFTQTTPAGHGDGSVGASGPITTVWYEDYIWASAGVAATV